MGKVKNFRVGHTVVFNDYWDKNVHLGGCLGDGSESPIPGGTRGVVTDIAPTSRNCEVTTTFGKVWANIAYLEHP
jgi:hypothetical protein